MPETEPLVIQEGLPEKVTSTKLEKQTNKHTHQL